MPGTDSARNQTTTFSVIPHVSIHPGTVTQQPNRAHDFLLRRSRHRHLAAGLAAAVVAVVLGGIGGIRAWSGDTNQSPAGSGGVVMISATGILRAVGGPANVGPRGLSGTVVFMNGGATAGSARAGSDGRFAIRVPAGRYAVIGTSPLYSEGAVTCRAQSVVTIAADGSAPPEIDVDCVER